MAWVVIVLVAKGLKLENRGFEIKAYSLTYKNYGVQAALTKMLNRTRRGIRVFADISVVAGFVEPDEEEFNKAKKISKLRVIGAGATSNVIFSFALGAVLLTNPLFAIVLPEPILGWMYEEPDGVLVLSIIEGSGAEKAGLQPNDIITAING